MLSVMNQQQIKERIAEIKLSLALWILMTVVVVAFPVFCAVIGCAFQIRDELDKFPLPYTVKVVALFCIPVAIVFGLIARKIQKRLDAIMFNNSEGEVIKNPAFVRIIGRKG